jgi:cyanophycinase
MDDTKGWIVLEGGAEFGGRMAEPDLAAVSRAGGFSAPVKILPTAAAPDHNHLRAGENGKRWFKALGCQDVEVLPVIDRSSAEDKSIAQGVSAARLIYLLGGFPAYLGQVLAGSQVWNACLDVFQSGGVIAGSSAGAMVLCEFYFDPYQQTLLKGLNLLPNLCVLPHYNSFGKTWLLPLRKQLPSAILMGIDEQTGLVGNRMQWEVFGAGSVLIEQPGASRVLHAGQFYP